MLQDIRDNSQGVIAKVIIGLIVAIFVLFGADSIIGGLTRPPSSATVNGEEITDFQLQNGVQDLINSIGGNAQGIEQSLLEQLAMNQLVEQTLLKQSAANSELGISGSRIDQALIENPNFQIGGVFDPEFAVRTMNSQGFSVQSYKEALGNQMLLSQLVNAYSSSSFATSAELETLAALSAQERDFRYLSLTPGTRTLGTAISDEEIAKYYAANQDDFIRPESVSVSYVILEKSALEAAIELEDGAVLAQYELEKSQFEGSAEKRASHILFETGAQLSEEEALASAEAALERLDAGESFEALALELSSDQVSAEEGGDIGFSDGTAFPEEIEEALLELSVGDYSEPVTTDFGVHVVLLTEDNTNVFQEFDEVSARIERELKSAQVEQLYASKLSDLSNLAFESSDLSRIESELELPILVSGSFDRSGGGGLFSDQSVLDAAFSDSVLLDGNNSDVVELGEDRAVVLRLDTQTPEGIYALDEVEPEIAVALRGEMEREAVRELGQQLLALLEAGEDESAFLEENELSWRTEASARRSLASVNRDIIEAVFALPAPANDAVERTAINLDNGAFVVAELTAVVEGSYERLAADEANAMREALLRDQGSNDLQAYVNNLRESGNIVISSTDDEEFDF